MEWKRIKQTLVKNAAGNRYKPATSTGPKNAAELGVSGLVKISRRIAVGNRQKVKGVA